MWRELSVRVGLRENIAPAPRETADELIAKTAELRELLDGLGYNPRREEAADRIMAELKSSIRAELTDYPAFQAAIAAATVRRQSMLPDESFALLDSLGSAGDQSAVLALLNADPIHDQVPFIEQIPVRKNGELTWRSPVDHSLIRRRPVDLRRFKELLDDLEMLFAEPHPARFEHSLLEVIDAIAKVRRELDRDKSYLPTPLQYLETKLGDYKTKSLKPGAARLTETLLSTIARLVELRNAVESGADEDVARKIAGQAARYLATPRLQTRWLTNYILVLLLHPKLTVTVGRKVGKREAKTIELIRKEIQDGYYDRREITRRLRRIEASGVMVASLVYPLLRLPAPVSGTPASEKELL